jgi:hypothetical protein
MRLCRCKLSLTQLGIILIACLLPIIHFSWSLPKTRRVVQSACLTDPSSRVDTSLKAFLDEHVQRAHQENLARHHRDHAKGSHPNLPNRLLNGSDRRNLAHDRPDANSNDAARRGANRHFS